MRTLIVVVVALLLAIPAFAGIGDFEGATEFDPAVEQSTAGTPIGGTPVALQPPQASGTSQTATAASDKTSAVATATATNNVNVPAPQIRIVRVGGGATRVVRTSGASGGGSSGRPVVVNNNVPAAQPPTVIVNIPPAPPATIAPASKPVERGNGMIIALWIVAGLGVGLGVCGLIALCTQGGAAAVRAFVNAIGALSDAVGGGTNGNFDGRRITGNVRLPSGASASFKSEPANATPFVPPVPNQPAPPQFGVANVQVPVYANPVYLNAGVPTQQATPAGPAQIGPFST